MVHGLELDMVHRLVLDRNGFTVNALNVAFTIVISQNFSI